MNKATLISNPEIVPGNTQPHNEHQLNKFLVQPPIIARDNGTCHHYYAKLFLEVLVYNTSYNMVVNISVGQLVTAQK